MFDKYNDECGVVGIYNHPEASTWPIFVSMRFSTGGQESADIASSDLVTLHSHKAMGLVADIFSKEVIATLPGKLRHRSRQVFHHRRLPRKKRAALCR